MAKKRGTGEGTVFQRADGRWVGTVSLGFDSTGKRTRKTVYGLTQAEVNGKLDDLKQQRKHGARSIVGKDTLAGYLQLWLDDVLLNKSAKTHQEYEGVIRLHILPHLGAQKLTKLEGQTLVSWQGKLARKGCSNDIRHRSIKILRAALSKAVKLRLIPFNPCACLDTPKVPKKEVIPLEPDQCRALISACQSHRLGDLIVLAAMTGLRKGELFALEWNAVNLTEGVLVVRRTLQEVRGLTLKEPKTESGKRVVSLGAEAIEALRNRKRKAEAEGLGECAFVFTNTVGGFLRASMFDKHVWYPIRNAAGIPKTFVFHGLRHTQASLMLAAGVDLKVIQQRLGHRNFQTTANVYSHLLQGAQDDAVAKVDAMMEKRAPKPVSELQ